MKKLIVLIALGIALPIQAQRQVEKAVSISDNQEVFLHFKFAENIKIEQWNKNEVLTKASVTIDDGEGNDQFSIQTEKDGDVVKIRSDFGNYFKERKDRHRDNCSMTTEIEYTVYVPENVHLRVKSISGDLEASSFKGTLKTELISGDVTIKKYNGELWLKTISGDLDVSIDRAAINAKTLSGNIYSNLDIEMDENRKNHSSYNRIRGTVNNGKQMVRMETISGDIYMRKI